ncbi:LIM and calponin homology domains-containing protein 1-like isoform X12 [Chiloscyllium plagiosum]|uniref:LIM and calponin homology domains-containing protein 1-like isoform X12 n=1 Tax=Chiloscyllium plagiosum TaxID=36176 RepID=UPI001CB879D2|nr:LIM and calponin homology domains-containing protein 1-like isoform X12 [Chiloscyllium plagiosum]
MASPGSRDTEWGESQQQDSGPGPAFTEAQHWIEQVTGRSFGDKDFRTGLENGILLCELLNAIKPGAVKKINRLPTPIAGLDNITLFLRACEELGLKGSQLFDPGDLQDMTNRATIKVSDYSRKMKNVLITIYWLGKTANSCTSYSGPTLNLKEFEGLLSQIQKEMDDTDSPKRSIRDSGYIDSWDSERSDSLSPPRHTRDDSFDSLDSFGSRSQQTPSPEVLLRGSSDGRGSDSETDVTQKAPDMKRDDMSVRRTSYSEPKSSVPFNQYLPNKSNHTAYMPAPLRKKRAERGENYRKSWSNTTSPVAAERPFSQSHIQVTESELIVPQKASMLLESQQENDAKVEEQQKGPDIERDDLARRKALGGFTGRQKPQTFSPSSITSADMEMWQKLQLSTDTSEDTSKPNKKVSEVKPMSETEVEKAAQDNPSCRKARSRTSASGSCQRSVHFGPVTEIDQQYWEKLNIAGTGPDSEAQKGADGCTIKTYTCHLLPSVASTVILNSQDSIIEGESQVISGNKISLDSQCELSCKYEDMFHTDTCTAEYFRRTPSPILVVQTVTLSESSNDSSEEDDDGKTPDLEKDDMMTRRIKASSKQRSAAFNKFLPVPSSQRGQSKSGISKGPEKDVKTVNKPKKESLRTYSPTDALSDDAGSISMIDMRPEDVTIQPHSKARHEELHNIHSRLREDQDKWQDDLARWKNRRRSASQDLIKRKEERDIVEKIMSGERSSERRRSIKTYREIVEEKECRELALQEAYKNARTPEEAEAILKKYSQRFIISEPILESLVMPKFLERSQSVDSDTPSSPTKDPNSLKYLRQQSLPIQKYTATVEAMIMPSSQSQTNVSATVTSPTRTIASKAVPMLTPKPYSQPKDSQTVLKSFKKDGKIRMNGETSPTFTRVEEKEPTSAIPTSSQMLANVASVDTPPLTSQIDDNCHVSGPEQEISSTINDPETEDTEQEERTEMPIIIGTSQQSSTEEGPDLKPCCNKTEKGTVKDTTQEEDHPSNLETSTVHIALSNNVTKNTVDSKNLMTDEAFLNPEKEKPSDSVQIQLQQETLKSEALQHGETGDVFESIQRISELEEETTGGSQPDNAISQQESPNTASVPVKVRNSWRRSEFFSQPAEVKDSENVNIPVAPLNLPKRFDRWYWDPEEERKRQERWQKEQERLLQERYRKEQEKLRQEWEKAQREVEEEERRYHEEERKIIQETVTPLTPQSPALSAHHPNEWICPSKREENSHSDHIESSSMDPENTNVKLQKDAVEAESWQAEDKGQMEAEEEHRLQKEQQHKLMWKPADSQNFKKDETEQQENWDETGKSKVETWHWQESKQLESEQQKLNVQSEVHIFQMDKETVSERQPQAIWQIPFADHQKLPAQAAGSPLFASKSWNTEEPPSFLEIPRKQQQGDVVKTGSLDRSWALQSNIMDRKNWSGSHENLQSGQSPPLPHSSLQLQAPSRSVSGKKLCSTCGLPLGKGAAMIIETLSLYFHIQCFTCGICKGQLGDATTGTDVRIRNGLLNCNDCYIRSRTAGQPTTL